MNTYDKITPEGTQDILFQNCIVRQDVRDAVMGLLYRRGFRPVMTPAMEFYDLFGANRYFAQESMYKLIDAQGRILVLRPDSTIPIARLTATKLQNEPYPVRLCYCQAAYRANPSLRGRMDEMSQCGAELIGAGGAKADLEMLRTASDCLEACGARPFTLEIGHIGIFRALMDELDAPEPQKEEVRQLIESKNYAALGDLLHALPDSPAVHTLGRLPRLFGGDEVFSQAAQLSQGPAFQAALQELEELYRRMMQVDPSAQVLVDFGLVNQAEYYTGVVFRGYLPGIGQPVLSGGRYDRLLDDFGVHQPAIGFAIHLDAVAGYLQQVSPRVPQIPQVLVYWEREQSARGFAHLRELWSQGVSCESSLADSKEDAAVYARARGIRRLQIVGDEIKEILIGEEPEA
ncbi:MAG: ATP phosphoribosyltransferase regulatory subunit [Oscillospiraceae bacterium]|nr:ATP phosphoribosyltransferase regulatory subunit [Oscillospiraceae bacterium]